MNRNQLSESKSPSANVQLMTGVSMKKDSNDHDDSAMFKRLQKIQGECRIESFQYLKIHYPKAIILMFLLIITIIGLFFLKAFMKMRRFVFYKSATSSDATQIFIKSNNNDLQIVDIERESSQIEFTYKNLKYMMIQEDQQEDTPIPKCFPLEQQQQKYLKTSHYTYGLTDNQVKEQREKFGKNQHIVEIQNYFQYMFDVLTAPFFILQYFFCIIYFLQKLYIFGIVLIAFTLVTTTINYIFLYRSFKKIRDMAERNMKVKVVRNGQIEVINDTLLVPGDIYIPEGEIAADSLVVDGNLYVNQQNLTGESVPIGKFKMHSIDQVYNSHEIWLNDGSKVLNLNSRAKALVVNTGYATIRGQIIRKIINRQVVTPDVVKAALIFVIQTIIVAFIVFFSTIWVLLRISNSASYIVFECLDYLTSMAPFPVYFNLAYTFSLRRLNNLNIKGTEPEKTVFGSQVKTFCFDKTGTITQSQVRLLQIYKLNQNSLQPIKQDLGSHTLIKKLFSTCHTVQLINSEIMGDEIDKEMYLFSGATISKKEGNDSVTEIVDDHNKIIKVLRVNQFESQFQSMSVLVKDQSSHKYYVFVKGAPQKIYQNSKQKFDIYFEKLKEFSIKGQRTIGIACKEIGQNELQKYMQIEREHFETNTDNLGLIAFENNLKNETVEAMERLRASGISSKMITGDNGFIAVETARRAGIITSFDKVIILEGHNQTREVSLASLKLKGTLLDKNKKQEQIQVSYSEYLNSTQYIFAVDGAFVELDYALSDKIKIFSRVKPEGKSLIIKKYKQLFKQDYQEKHTNCWQRMIDPKKSMVGMCGDGANDLLALKQADLSIGMQQTDASYGSSFIAKELTDVPAVIRQGKTVTYNIIHIVQFYIACYFTMYLGLIWLNSDATYLSSEQLIFMDFGSFLWVPVFLALTGPVDSDCRTTPSVKFISLYNHLLVWGTVILMYGFFLGGFLFFYLSEDYQPNPTPLITDDSGFHPYNHSMTIIFLLVILFIPIVSFAVFRSNPWNKRIYYNIILTIFLIANMIAAIVFTLITDKLIEAFKIKEIPIKYGGISIGFIVGGGIIVILYNILINHFKWNEEQIGDEQQH